MSKLELYTSIQITLNRAIDSDHLQVSVSNNGAVVSYMAITEKEVDIVKDCFTQIGDVMDAHLSRLPSPTTFKFED